MLNNVKCKVKCGREWCCDVCTKCLIKTVLIILGSAIIYYYTIQMRPTKFTKHLTIYFHTHILGQFQQLIFGVNRSGPHKGVIVIVNTYTLHYNIYLCTKAKVSGAKVIDQRQRV